MDWLFPAAMALTGAMGVLMGLWGLWYLLAGGFCWRKPMDYGWHPAMTRFAVLIAARNEEQVIGPLINSLLTQDYPADLYDIWVIPNNCTDHTAQAARGFGARVLECPFPVKSKGGPPPLPGGDEQRLSGGGGSGSGLPGQQEPL